MAKARVTHLRHVGVAVPDYDKQVTFYEDVWGLKKVDGEDRTRDALLRGARLRDVFAEFKVL